MRLWPYALLLVASCGVKLGQGNGDAPDGSTTGAPDARSCMGGAHVTDANGSCFVFFLGPKAQAGAAADCAAIGGHLAAITSAETNALVTTILSNKNTFIGATDAVTEGAFVWHDANPLTYTNWRTGEPNNGGGSAQEQCAIILGAENGKWDDRPCGNSYAYLCQY